jgi:hypothetical protein
MKLRSIPEEKDDLFRGRKGEFLSYSKMNRYLLCPEQYRLYYIERLRPRIERAGMVFGQVIHQALAFLFRENEDPVARFIDVWDQLEGAELDYGKRDSWEKFRHSGEGLLRKFLNEQLCRIGEVYAAEKSFELNITGLDLPFIGIIDLLAKIDGKVTVADFKNRAAAAGEHDAMLSDQLAAYKLAEPEVEEGALWVFVRAKDPAIELLPGSRDPKQLTEFIDKVGYVAREIKAGSFYKRPGMWCSWCDFLPVCLGNKENVQRTLIHVNSKASA